MKIVVFIILYLSFLNYSRAEPKKFQIVTDSYRAQYILQDKSLLIKLNDFEQQTIYYKKLTPQDIGSMIHKRADLAQIFYFLTLPHKEIKNALTQGEQSVQKQRQHYQFGTDAMYGKIPCYRIQHQGRMRVYGSYENVQNQKIAYQSKIALRQYKKMTQSEIFRQKYVTAMQTRAIRMRKELFKDLKILEYQNNFLAKQIKDIKTQQSKLQQRLKKLQGKSY